MTLIFSKRLVCRKGALYFLVVFACLVGYVIAECFFRDSFEAYSDEICIQDQKHYSNTWFKFLSFMTNMGYGLPISIIVLFYFEVSKNKINAIFLILLTTYINYFLSIIKMLYHQPRPYMRNPEIQPLFKCGEEWGDPSGHALSGFLFYFIVFNSLRKRLLDLKFTDAGDLSKSRDISGSPNHKGPQDLELKEVSRHGKSKESMPNDCEHNKEHLILFFLRCFFLLCAHQPQDNCQSGVGFLGSDFPLQQTQNSALLLNLRVNFNDPEFLRSMDNLLQDGERL